MSFLQQPVTAGPGLVVRVRSDNPRIRAYLLDAPNFHAYQTGQGFYYEDGGVFTAGPNRIDARLQASRFGTWYLVVDRPGGGEPSATYTIEQA